MTRWTRATEEAIADGGAIRARYRAIVAAHGIVITPGRNDARMDVVTNAMISRRGAQCLRPSIWEPRDAQFSGAIIQLMPDTLSDLRDYLAGGRTPPALDAHCTMVHETLHECGPLPRADGSGDVQAVDEVITELATRRIAAEHARRDSYQRLIEIVIATARVPLYALTRMAMELKRTRAEIMTATEQLCALLPSSRPDVVESLASSLILHEKGND